MGRGAGGREVDWGAGVRGSEAARRTHSHLGGWHGGDALLSSFPEKEAARFWEEGRMTSGTGRGGSPNAQVKMGGIFPGGSWSPRDWEEGSHLDPDAAEGPSGLATAGER